MSLHRLTQVGREYRKTLVWLLLDTGHRWGSKTFLSSWVLNLPGHNLSGKPSTLHSGLQDIKPWSSVVPHRASAPFCSDGLLLNSLYFTNVNPILRNTKMDAVILVWPNKCGVKRMIITSLDLLSVLLLTKFCILLLFLLSGHIADSSHYLQGLFSQSCSPGCLYHCWISWCPCWPIPRVCHIFCGWQGPQPHIS